MTRLAVVFTFVAGLTACFDAWGADMKGKPDFTGTWNLNLPKSNFGKSPKPVSMTLVAAKKGDVLHATQKIEDGQGLKSTEGDWFLDGKQHPVDPAAQAGNKQTQMSTWKGNTLYAERKSEDGSYREQINMTLSRDGKTATEKIAVKSPNGSNSSTLVWDRK